MAEYKLGNIDFWESLDPETKKLFEEQMKLKNPELSLPSSTPDLGGKFDLGTPKPLEESRFQAMSRGEFEGLPSDQLKPEYLENGAPSYKSYLKDALRLQLEDRLINQEADTNKYKADVAKAAADAGPSGWQKGLGYLAAGLQGMATKGKDLSLASSLKKGWDKDIAAAKAGVKDPSVETKAILDNYIKMKALEGDDKKFGQQKELKQMEIDAYKEREKYKADLEKKKEAAKPTEFGKATQKEQAKRYSETQAAIPQISKNLQKVDDALDAQLKYSRESLGGTGPIATGFGLKKYISQDAQNLEAKYRDINLKNMVSTFSGMSKAVDSDAERRAWESTQASLSNDDEVNLGILLGAKSSLMKDQAVAEAQAKYVKQYGNLDGFEQQNPILRGEMTTLVDNKGNMQIVNKSDVPKLEEKGLLKLDDYVSRVAKGGYNREVKGLSAEDREALNWLRDNPNHPRAEAVRKKLGM